MKKPLKTLIFIMNHGRMRMGLVKRIRNQNRLQDRFEYDYRDSDKYPGPLPVRKYISSEFPNLPQPPKRPETPKRKFTTTRMQPKTDPPRERTRPSKPYPEPKEKLISLPHKKRKFTDNEIGGKDLTELVDFMSLEELTEEIERRFIQEFKRGLPF